MCFMDWRIGRLIRSVSTIQAVANGVTFQLPPNKQRVGLQLIPGVSQPWSIAPTGAFGPGVGAALQITQSNGWDFNLAEHGDLPMVGWDIRNIGAAQCNILIIEHYAPESYITAALEQFKQQYGIVN